MGRVVFRVVGRIMGIDRLSSIGRENGRVKGETAPFVRPKSSKNAKSHGPARWRAGDFLRAINGPEPRPGATPETGT
jgi:hypothetical protein